LPLSGYKVPQEIIAVPASLCMDGVVAVREIAFIGQAVARIVGSLYVLGHLIVAKGCVGIVAAPKRDANSTEEEVTGASPHATTLVKLADELPILEHPLLVCGGVFEIANVKSQVGVSVYTGCRNAPILVLTNV
jgi:hypothetical protein